MKNKDYSGKAVLKYALGTRIVVILLQYFSNIIIPDHNAGVFLHPQTINNYNVADKIIHHLLEGFVRWDAQYFMHIAKYGYSYENTLAFFPLYPLMVRFLSKFINLVCPWIHLDSMLLLTSIGLNVVFFVLCAKVLFTLTAIFFDEGIAYKSTLLFCFNPASIFFSAPYSECVFCYFTFQSMLNCIQVYKKYYSSNNMDYCDVLQILPICLSTIARSNGILNIGFLMYTCLCLYKRHWPNIVVKKAKSIPLISFAICLLAGIGFIPFFIYQMYCYYMYCTNREFEFPLMVLEQAKSNNFVLPGQFSRNNQSWCYKNIPLAYSYVQSHYWNVGFFKYYELKQFPNFLLAAPILAILIKKSCLHLKHNATKNVMDIFSFDTLFNKKKHTNITFNPLLNVFVVHILFLSLFCAFCVHVQVSTRMLCSASPILYWFCASSFKNRKFVITDIFHGNMSLEEYGIIFYFLSYFIIGTVLFCNFLPWT